MKPKPTSPATRGFDRPTTGLPNPVLEIFIPFTTLHNAQRSVRHAEWLCSGLDAHLRILRVVEVPYPLDIDHPAVARDATREELEALESELPMTAAVWYSRDWAAGFLAALPASAMVILTYQRRLLMTREEKLSRALKRAGHRVSMFLEEKNRG